MGYYYSTGDLTQEQAQRFLHQFPIPCFADQSWFTIRFLSLSLSLFHVLSAAVLNSASQLVGRDTKWGRGPFLVESRWEKQCLMQMRKCNCIVNK